MKRTSSKASHSRRVVIVALVVVGVATGVAVMGAVAAVHRAQASVPSLAPSPVETATATATATETVTETVTATDTTTVAPPVAHLDEPVTVRLKGRNGIELVDVLTPADLRAAATTTDTGTALDASALAKRVDPRILDPVQQVANARLRVVANETVTVVPARTGYVVTAQSLARDVTTVLARAGAERDVTLVPEAIEPTFTTAQARALGVHELVSSYTQRFPAAQYRTTNIGTAARYISGTLLMPGQVFSMNDTIKARTPANGYVPGWIIGPNGVFRMELGGAVSTMTTALYNAAWFAGVRFVEHRAHSVYISRYPAGREATVSWGDFDMRFANTLAHPLWITVQMHPSSVSVFFWGTREWDDIGTVFGPWTDIVGYPTIRSDDANCTEQDGVVGFRITTWRTFMRAGAEVRREAFHTRYAPTPRVVCGAQGKPSPKPTPKPSRTPSVTPSVTPTVVATDTSTA